MGVDDVIARVEARSGPVVAKWARHLLAHAGVWLDPTLGSMSPEYRALYVFGALIGLTTRDVLDREWEARCRQLIASGVEEERAVYIVAGELSGDEWEFRRSLMHDRESRVLVYDLAQEAAPSLRLSLRQPVRTYLAARYAVPSSRKAQRVRDALKAAPRRWMIGEAAKALALSGALDGCADAAEWTRRQLVVRRIPRPDSPVDGEDIWRALLVSIHDDSPTAEGGCYEGWRLVALLLWSWAGFPNRSRTASNEVAPVNAAIQADQEKDDGMEDEAEVVVLRASPVRTARKCKGWSQKELAKRAGLGRTTVQDAERGIPSHRSAEKMTEVLNRPAKWLRRPFFDPAEEPELEPGPDREAA